MRHQFSNERSRAARIDGVLLTAFDSEFAFLKSICRVVGIHLHHAATVEQADFLLMATGATVLLSDVMLVDCSWRSALDLISDRHPLVTLLVIADPVDEPFLRDAYTVGASGILWKPIQFDRAIRLIRMAHHPCAERQRA